MTNFTRILAASACAFALSACATNDRVLDDSQTVGVRDNDTMMASGGRNMDSGLDDKFTVGCDDDDRFESRGCDGIDSDGDGIDRDIYASDREREDFYRMNNITYTPRTAVMATDSIADIVEASDMTLLRNALIAADLLDTLDGDGEYTVFAPTDAAFTRADLSELGDQEDMRELLLNHVVPGRFLALDFVELLGTGSTYSTAAVGGAPLTIYRSGDNLRLVNGDRTLVPILTADRVASNGVIHIIDTVLVPPMN